MKRELVVVGWLLAAGACAVTARADELEGRFSWAGIRPHPAVVNPVGRPPDDPDTLSLRGEWDFRTTTMRTTRNSPLFKTRTGRGGHGGFWWPKGSGREGELRKINVPGCWEWQGVGTMATSMPCFVRWDVGPKPLRHAFWCDGWYRKCVTIPARWAGKRIWLKTGWANSYGLFWVNGHQVAYDLSYCGTYKYDVTDFVTPGSNAMVVVEVTNDQPSRRGTVNSINHWGGLMREPEFEATPQVYIDDAWVRGDFDGKRAQVNVLVDGEDVGAGYSVRAEVEGRVAETALVARASCLVGSRQSVDGSGEKVKREVGVNSEKLEKGIVIPPLSNSNSSTLNHQPSTALNIVLSLPLDDFRPWSPEHPNLYWAKIELLKDGRIVQTRRERFGVRKIEVRGTDFYLNGKPFFMRGAGWHYYHPIEGAALPDRAIWLAKVKKVRAAGFNIVRTHTYCNVPEFFEACDEAGLMVQPELPYYTDVPRDGQPFDPIGDARELYEHFRRYPSFAVYSGGNEGWFGPRLTRRLYDEIRTRDPDRLMVGQDTWYNKENNKPGMSDFEGGPMTVWPRGSVVPTDLPFVCHEYLNLCVKLDSRTEPKYTGVYLPPVSRAARAAWLASFGLGLDWGDRLQDAQHVMQSVWRKYGFESARVDPYCDGYSYWSLQDAASPQKGSYSAQALFDQFWDAKPHGDTAEDVAVYNSCSCLLMTDGNDPYLWRTDPRKVVKGGVPTEVSGFEMFVDAMATNRVRSAGERIRARFHLAHFGEAPIRDAKLEWSLVAQGRAIASGTVSVGDQAVGASRVLGSADITIPDLDKACRAVLTARIGGIANSWDYWLFPTRREVGGWQLVDGSGESNNRMSQPPTPNPQPTTHYQLPAKQVACADEFRAQLAPRYGGMLGEKDWKAADIVICSFGGELERAALAAGKSVVALTNQTGKADVFLGWWWMGNQMGAAIKDHPALAAFPHQGFLNPLFFRIGKTGIRLPVAGIAEKDLVMVGEGAEACFLYLADVPQPNGSHRFVVAGLDVLSDTAEGTALLDGVLSAVGSGEKVKVEGQGQERKDKHSIVHPHLSPSPSPPNSQPSSLNQLNAARDVIARFAGADVANQLSLSFIPAEDGLPTYEIADNGKTLRGSSPVALAKAFYDNCRRKNAGIRTWTGKRFDAGAAFAPSKDVRVVSPFRYHQMFNVVTYGYTMPFWDEARWMEELDWLALHGQNMMQAQIANEAIAARVWKRLGLTDAEIDAYFCGPAYLPWLRMGNLSAHPGTLPPAWRARSIRLQHAVLDRMRLLGIEPIVPGFGGFLPAAVARVRPGLRLRHTYWQGADSGFDNWFLSPDQPAFREISRMYVEEWEREFGACTYYLADSFNEMELPWNTEDGISRGLADCGENIILGMRDANPNAVWTVQGWIFVCSPGTWKPNRFAAMQSRVPDGAMLVLDLAVDYVHFIGRRFDAKPGLMDWEKFPSFGGQPWIWSVIPNMGGVSIPGGVLDYYANGHLEALASRDRARLVGHGIAAEGIENNELLFELCTEAGWQTRYTSVRGWLVNYARSRYGKCPEKMVEAYDALLAGPYARFMDHPIFSWQRVGSDFHYNTDPYKGFAAGGGDLAECMKRAAAAFEACADEMGGNALYRFDLAQLKANALGYEAHFAFARDDRDTVRRCLGEIEMLLKGHPTDDFRVWLARARAAGEGDDVLADAYERNARELLTLWGAKTGDYSCRVWSGLVGSHYLPRLEAYWSAKDAGEDTDAAVRAFCRGFIDNLTPIGK